MALGTATIQPPFENPREILGDRLREGSIYRLSADEGHKLFPDDYFADLYADSVRGRPTIPARVMATVIMLQAFEGLSDRKPPIGWKSTCVGRQPVVWTQAPRRSIRPTSSASATGCALRSAPGGCSRTPKRLPTCPGDEEPGAGIRLDPDL